MEFAPSLSTQLDNTSQKNSLWYSVKEWVDSNMYFADQGFVWRIGITNAENIVKVEAMIRKDMQCKHWRYWRADSFRHAMGIIRQVNSYPFMFKSPHNMYEGKGSYLFVYKTTIPEKKLFYHTLHS